MGENERREGSTYRVEGNFRLNRGCEKSVRKRHQGVFFSESQWVSLEVDFRWLTACWAVRKTVSLVRIQLSTTQSHRTGVISERPEKPTFPRLACSNSVCGRQSADSAADCRLAPPSPRLARQRRSQTRGRGQGSERTRPIPIRLRHGIGQRYRTWAQGRLGLQTARNSRMHQREVRSSNPLCY